MAQDVALPPLPGYPIPKLLKLRDEIENAVRLSFGGAQFTLAAAEDLSAVICRCLPSAIPAFVVTQSLFHCAGKTLTAEVVRSLAWLLAGNLHILRAGLSVFPWKAPGALEWVPVQVTGAWPAPRRFDKPQVKLSLRILAGGPAGTLLEKPFGTSQLAIAAKHFGFTRSRGASPYREPAELVLLRFYALLDPARTRGSEPSFKEMACPSGCLTHNKGVLDRRFRRDPCPNQYSHRCTQCPIGYNSCIGATHRETYVKRFCQGCGRDAYHDPELHTDMCVVCWGKQQLALKGHA